MCGLFGYAGVIAGDPEVVRAAAVLAARRGPDAWGVISEQQPLVKRLGRLRGADADALQPGRYLIGHCRLATVLNTHALTAVQPLVVGRTAVAHNGSVENLAALGLTLTTGNDSEAIARLVDATPNGPLFTRVEQALQQLQLGDGYALAVLDLETRRVVLRRRALPLYVWMVPTGRYWCSVQPDERWTLMKES